MMQNVSSCEEHLSPCVLYSVAATVVVHNEGGDEGEPVLTDMGNYVVYIKVKVIEAHKKRFAQDKAHSQDGLPA
jgi:ribose 5-phosphate isomerase